MRRVSWFIFKKMSHITQTVWLTCTWNIQQESQVEFFNLTNSFKVFILCFPSPWVWRQLYQSSRNSVSGQHFIIAGSCVKSSSPRHREAATTDNVTKACGSLISEIWNVIWAHLKMLLTLKQFSIFFTSFVWLEIVSCLH